MSDGTHMSEYCIHCGCVCTSGEKTTTQLIENGILNLK